MKSRHILSLRTILSHFELTTKQRTVHSRQQISQVRFGWYSCDTPIHAQTGESRPISGRLERSARPLKTHRIGLAVVSNPDVIVRPDLTEYVIWGI